MEEQMESKIEKIKQYFKRNKKEYIIGAVSTAVGAIGGIAFVILTSPKEEEVNQEIWNYVRQRFIANYKPTNTFQTISVYGNRIGRPGNPVYDTGTGKRYESQLLAAIAVGVDSTKMSDHLHGRYDHVNGHVFRWIGE